MESDNLIFGFERSIPGGSIQIEAYESGRLDYVCNKPGDADNDSIPFGMEGEEEFLLQRENIDEYARKLRDSLAKLEPQPTAFPWISVRISENGSISEYGWPSTQDSPEEVQEIFSELREEAEAHLEKE